MAEDESKAAVSKDCLYDNLCVFVVLLFSLNLIQSQDSKEPEAKLHSFLCFRNSCIWMRCWYTATFGPGPNGWCCGNEGQPIQSGHCFKSWSIMMCMLIWRMNRDLLLRSLRPKVLGKRIVMAKLCVCVYAGRRRSTRANAAARHGMLWWPHFGLPCSFQFATGSEACWFCHGWGTPPLLHGGNIEDETVGHMSLIPGGSCKDQSSWKGPLGQHAVCCCMCTFFFLIGQYGFAGAVHWEGSRASIVLSYASFRLNSGRHPCWRKQASRCQTWKPRWCGSPSASRDHMVLVRLCRSCPILR